MEGTRSKMIAWVAANAVHDYSYQKCPLHTEDQNYQHQKHRMHNYLLIVV